MAKKRAFTGLQPSGALHIGNYFGALQPVLQMYQEYETMLCVVDYHALTTVRDGALMRRNILDMTRDYLAVGVDPKAATIFKQSDVPEHTELAWILSCVTPVAMLELAHAYKDTAGKGKEATTGLFTYPVLMAADIILYDTDVVPVGEDQRQHVEYARDIAGKFNRAFGETFKEPAERILKTAAVIPGTDGRKMSKSYKNTIPLFATKDEIADAVMSIVTDSGQGTKYELEYETPNSKNWKLATEGVIGAVNVFKIHSLFRDFQSLVNLYNNYRNNYKGLKEMLIEDLERFIAPMRSRRNEISDADVQKVLKEGGEKAQGLAAQKMQDVRSRIGVTID